MLPDRHSPLQKNGNGNQGCYLAGIPDALGHVLMAMLDMHQVRELDQPPRYAIDHEPNTRVLDDIHRIETDASIPETQRLQLAKARVGQGFFRKQVVLLDQACRATGVTDTQPADRQPHQTLARSFQRRTPQRLQRTASVTACRRAV